MIWKQWFSCWKGLCKASLLDLHLLTTEWLSEAGCLSPDLHAGWTSPWEWLGSVLWWASPSSLSSGQSRFPSILRVHYTRDYKNWVFIFQLSVRQHPRWSVGTWKWDSCCHRSPLAPPLLEPQVYTTMYILSYFHQFPPLFRLPTWHTVHSLAANRNLGLLTLAFRFILLTLYPNQHYQLLFWSSSIGATVYYIYTAISEHQPVYPIEDRWVAPLHNHIKWCLIIDLLRPAIWLPGSGLSWQPSGLLAWWYMAIGNPPIIGHIVFTSKHSLFHDNLQSQVQADASGGVHPSLR